MAASEFTGFVAEGYEVEYDVDTGFEITPGTSSSRKCTKDFDALKSRVLQLEEILSVIINSNTNNNPGAFDTRPGQRATPGSSSSKGDGENRTPPREDGTATKTAPNDAMTDHEKQTNGSGDTAASEEAFLSLLEDSQARREGGKLPSLRFAIGNPLRFSGGDFRWSSGGVRAPSAGIRRWRLDFRAGRVDLPRISLALPRVTWDQGALTRPFQQIKEEFGGWVKSKVWDPIWGWIKKNIVNPVVNVFKSVGKWIGEQIKKWRKQFKWLDNMIKWFEKLPTAIYDGVVSVINLVKRPLEKLFVNSWRDAESASSATCKALGLKGIPVVWHLCLIPMMTYNLIFEAALRVIGEAMHLLFDGFQALVNKTPYMFLQVAKVDPTKPLPKLIEFGNRTYAESSCALLKELISKPKVNIPHVGEVLSPIYLFLLPNPLGKVLTYLQCVGLVRFMMVANSALNVVFMLLEQVMKLLPEKVFYPGGFSFGGHVEAQDACNGFNQMIQGLRLFAAGPSLWLQLTCYGSYRISWGVKSLWDALFHHLAKVTKIPFPNSAAANATCSSWKSAPFSNMGGAIAQQMFVSCTVVSRLIAPIEYALHLGLDALQKAIGSKHDTYTMEIAQAECAWKHYGLFRLMGFVIRMFCTVGLRIFNTVLVGLLELFIVMSGHILRIKPPTMPVAPDPVCNWVKAELEKIPIVKELPLFVLTVPCGVLLRLGRVVVDVALKVLSNVLDFIISTLLGDGPGAEIVGHVFNGMVEQAVSSGGDLLAMMDGVDVGDIVSDVATIGEKIKNGTQLFGMPKPISDLSMDVAVPSARTGFKYLKVYSLLRSFMQSGPAGMNNSTGPTGASATVLAETGNFTSVDSNESSASSNMAEFLEVHEDDVDAISLISLGERATQRSSTKYNAFATGSQMSMLGNGIGIGGPVEVRQSFGHRLVIHSRVMHPSYNNVNSGVNADALAMCLKRVFRVVDKLGTHGDSKDGPFHEDVTPKIGGTSAGVTPKRLLDAA
eukprot:g796.t1